MNARKITHTGKHGPQDVDGGKVVAFPIQTERPRSLYHAASQAITLIESVYPTNVWRPAEADALESLRGGRLVTRNSQPSLVNYQDTLKRCRGYGDLRPIYEFGPDPRNRDGLKSYCQKYLAEQARERRAKAAA